MITVALESLHDFEEWRIHARTLIGADVPPSDILWYAPGAAPSLFADTVCPPAISGTEVSRPVVSRLARPITVPAAFIDLARHVICHRDEERFARLYGLLWRMQSVRGLIANSMDDDVRWLRARAKNIHRDVHKMHAFVRFRKVGQGDGREAFAAWFEPEHYIMDLTASFFVKRFYAMDWSIITPHRRAIWQGEKLSLGQGGEKSEVPANDIIEDEWRTYYASIFNPARVKIQAMQSEMPKKYWKNLPEAQCISPLLQQAKIREQQMRENALQSANPRAAKWQNNSAI